MKVAEETIARPAQDSKIRTGRTKNSSLPDRIEAFDSGVAGRAISEEWSDPRTWCMNIDQILFLIWPDVKVSCKQTVLGAAWVIVRPVFWMLVFAFILNRLAAFSSEGVPYQLFIFPGILAWGFFLKVTGSS